MLSLCSPSESGMPVSPVNFQLLAQGSYCCFHISGNASTLNLLICSSVGKWPTTLVKQMFLSEMLPSAWFLKPMWSMELITKAVNNIFSIYKTLLFSGVKSP
ncbi:hypothetical protein CMV_008416 [Castanea mollissima]|uniref:Uncharacterized protein n=1 Tax=Castanea mollissima TaxID=60419 RepID=A0A8J4RG84_9ROSI|nr:hypothetical protein CMV_008416 [Castanea mollissima]